MKILIVMGGFFPGKKYGGPPVSIDNFCSLMKEDECFIVTHNHDLFEQEKFQSVHDGWNDRGNCKVLYLSDDEYTKSSFEKTMIEIKPDILYLQGLFQSCVFPCLQLAKKHNIKVVLAPRGELCSGALNIKKWKKIPYIELLRFLGLVKNIHWQSTSDEETAAIKQLMNVKSEKIHHLDNIPSIPRTDYSRRDKISGEGRFVFLSRIHPKKNLLSAINYFSKVDKKAYFDIYGPIEDTEYWKQCQEAIKFLPNNIKVCYKGLIGHDQVHAVFSQYDAFLFPTLSENYGHVIAESLVVGTPVIISDQTPWTDINALGFGKAISLNEPETFTEEINKIISMGKNEMEIASDTVKKYAMLKMDINSLKNEYMTVF